MVSAHLPVTVFTLGREDALRTVEATGKARGSRSQRSPRHAGHLDLGAVGARRGQFPQDPCGTTAFGSGALPARRSPRPRWSA